MEQRRSQSIVQDKSFRFAVQLVGYIRRQPTGQVNLVLTRQLLRSGTSIVANVLANLLKECDGLLRMLNSIILTTRRKLTSVADSEPKPRTQNSELRTQNSTLNTRRSR